MRGEYAMQCARVFMENGSPPHAWGIWFPEICVCVAVRFTPTCVGNIKKGKGKCISATVHPHMRGEYVPITRYRVAVVGSPPHAWGICYKLLID